MKTKLIIGSAFFIVSIMGCKKHSLISNNSPALAGLIVANGISNSGSIYVNRSPDFIYSGQADFLAYKSGRAYAIPNGVVPVKLVSRADTAKMFFNLSLNLETAGIYSLYSTGNAMATDTFFVKENDFPRTSDSAMYVRVVNLSMGSVPVNIAINYPAGVLGATATMVPIYNNLGYKGTADFVKVNLNTAATNSSLPFIITNATTGATMLKYDLTSINSKLARFKAITLVICGVYGGVGTDAYSMYIIANY